MKIMCICVGGQVRSPALANQLIAQFGVNAVPIAGANPFSGNFNWYVQWADKIIVIGQDALDAVKNKIPPTYEFINLYDTFGGPDVPELKQKMVDWCEQNKNLFI